MGEAVWLGCTSVCCTSKEAKGATAGSTTYGRSQGFTFHPSTNPPSVMVDLFPTAQAFCREPHALPHPQHYCKIGLASHHTCSGTPMHLQHPTAGSWTWRAHTFHQPRGVWNVDRILAGWPECAKISRRPRRIYAKWADTSNLCEMG